MNLTKLEEWILLTDEASGILSVVLSLIIVLCAKKLDSTTISAVVFGLTFFLMSVLTPVLLPVAIKDGIENKALWHLSFATIDLLGICLVLAGHRYKRVRLNPKSLSLCLSFTVFLILQIEMLLEKAFLDSLYLDGVYMLMIPTIDIALMLMFGSVACSRVKNVLTKIDTGVA